MYIETVIYVGFIGCVYTFHNIVYTLCNIVQVGSNVVQCMYTMYIFVSPNVYNVPCNTMYIHNVYIHVAKCIYRLRYTLVVFNAVQCIYCCYQMYIETAKYVGYIRWVYTLYNILYTLCNMIENLCNTLQCIYKVLPNVYGNCLCNTMYIHNVYSCSTMYIMCPNVYTMRPNVYTVYTL